MIQTQTTILIKDNSHFLEGKCICANQKNSKKAAKVGNYIKTSILKVKPNPTQRNLSGRLGATSTSKKALQDLLIIQTKAPIFRKDGATIRFYANTGVSIMFKKAGTKQQHQLGFKRINTTVPFDLKNKMYGQRFKAAYNIIKVAKNLL